MANWSDLEKAEAEMAALGRALLARHQVAYLATVRPDGGPRVHHVCPAIAGDAIYVSVSARSPKLRDLRTDCRYMLHFMCGEEDAEFNLRGVAREAVTATEQERVRSAARAQDIRFTDDEILFRLEIVRADCTRWEHFGTPRISPKRRRWIADEGTGVER